MVYFWTSVSCVLCTSHMTICGKVSWRYKRHTTLHATSRLLFWLARTLMMTSLSYWDYEGDFCQAIRRCPVEPNNLYASTVEYATTAKGHFCPMWQYERYMDCLHHTYSMSGTMHYWTIKLNCALFTTQVNIYQMRRRHDKNQAISRIFTSNTFNIKTNRFSESS